MWDRSDEESSEDQEDSLPGSAFFFTEEQWNPWELQPFDQHMLAL